MVYKGYIIAIYMRNNTDFILKIFLALGDVAAIVASFALAYFFRIHIDARPYFFVPQLRDFVVLIACLSPLWVIIASVSSLYKKEVYLNRIREYGRILLVSIISEMLLISYGFFMGDDIFPVRVIAIYFIGISFMLMIINRELVRLVRRILFLFGVGYRKILIIGNNKIADDLVEYFLNNTSYGYKVVGIVAKGKASNVDIRQFANLDKAVKALNPDALLRISDDRADDIYQYTIDHHLSYMFIPNQSRLSSQSSRVEIIDSYPVIDVKITNMSDEGRFTKRLFDIVIGSLMLVMASPIMLVVTILMKISDPKGKVFFRQLRLTRFNRQFYVYKFRSMKSSVNGLSPEEAFTKMGKPELSKIYRQNGDQIKNDPRITKIGQFLRSTSLDELPQLFNVISGGISLVGPRALVPDELNKYDRKNLILAVKSGLTGLAQVSGRREISFSERRRLDIYYLQNWSLFLDIQILFKTIVMVLFRKGAN